MGGLNTLFGYSVFALSLWSGLPYPAAIAMATVLGTLFNFKSVGALVFRSRGHSLLPRFILVYCIVYVINVLGIATLLRLDIPEWLGGLILALPLALLSYTLNSRYVFPS